MFVVDNIFCLMINVISCCYLVWGFVCTVFVDSLIQFLHFMKDTFVCNQGGPSE